MAPIPDDDDHYEGGAPLDGGSSPADLAGNGSHLSPTGLEIGVITGVVALVVLTLVGLFVWRSRKNRAAKNADSSSSVAASNPFDDSHANPHGTRETFEPVPPPKDSFAGAVKNDDLSSLEHSTPIRPDRPAMKWNQWVGTRRGSKRDQVEEHEIADRV
ncbi:hypothetical protein F4677DRAFT_407597 [Hypoxylon crocopeplum]|nr:hypothetical protein F4677DRAFT_407597 [Hypoxylon crocopeplum]